MKAITEYLQKGHIHTSIILNTENLCALFNGEFDSNNFIEHSDVMKPLNVYYIPKNG